ncbi:MAG: hypothetical protein WBP26_06155 [Candidatus Saccharimonadales bacterium]
MSELSYAVPERDDKFLALALNGQQQSIANLEVYQSVQDLTGRLIAGVAVPDTIQVSVLTPLSARVKLAGFGRGNDLLPRWEGKPHKVEDVVSGWVLSRCVYTSLFPYQGEPTTTWQDAVLTSSFKIVPGLETEHDGNEYFTLWSNLRPIEKGDLLGPQALPEGRQTYLWPRIAAGLQEIGAQK